MRTMGKTTAGILHLVLFGLLALIGTSTATAELGPAASSNLHRVHEAASFIKARGEGRRLQDGYPSMGAMCTAGVPGLLHNNYICCSSSCGKCTGSGCSASYTGPTDEFNGDQSCCESGIKSTKRVCSPTVGAPCIVVPEEGTCMPGVPGILYKNKMCCNEGCDACGVSGCSRNYRGPSEFTGHQACCQSGMKDTGRICSATVGAPCVLSNGQPTPTPPTPTPPTPTPPTPTPTDDDLVEAKDVTTVTVDQPSEKDKGYDQRTSGNGCAPNGCLPGLAYDGKLDNDSRWSCTEELAGGQCDITFKFEDAIDLRGMEVFFYKGEERQRTLKVTVNGQRRDELLVSTEGAVMTSYDIQQDGVSTVTLESIGIGEAGWISLLEVKFLAEP